MKSACVGVLSITGVVVSNLAQGLELCMLSSVIVLHCIDRGLGRSRSSVEAVLPNACN